MAIWKSIVGALIWLIILIVLAIPLGLLALYKVSLCLVLYFFKIRGENGVDRLYSLDPVDCMFAPDSSSKRPLANFGFFMIIEGKIGVEELRSHFQTCFLNENEDNRYEKLYSHLERFGGYIFRATAPTLDINEHVVERRMEEGEIWEEFLVKWMLEKWKQLKPCWEIIVVPLKRNGMENEETIVAFKIHHGLADGYSLIHILDKLTGCQSPYLVKDFEKGWVFKQMKQILEMPLTIRKFGGWGGVENNPFRVKLNFATEGKFVDEFQMGFTTVNLEDVKRIRRNYGVKLASVLLTIMTGAMRRYALEVEGREEIPEEFLGALTLPWPKHPTRQPGTRNKDKLCNHWVTGFLKLPLKEQDPEVRVKTIEAGIHLWQEELGLDKFMGRIMLPLMWLVPRLMGEDEIGLDAGSGGGVTSLVGSEQEYTLLGKRVKNVFPWMVITDTTPFTGLNCFTFSHGGKLNLSFGAHPSVLMKQENLNLFSQKLFHEELERFLKLI
ncbi:unnamed protein product [Orchesella dallaii]|uniref:O-acyltransferase WSD1 C-terminal domain-containing protein n=1 Tax=Orchesella dallaii TaxID=48710 RepID=A0ABP1S4A2_9HEXA